MSVSSASLPLTSLAPPPRALSFPYFKFFHFPIRTPNHKFSKRLIANADFSSSAPTSSTVEEEQQEEDSYQVLSAMKSDYNDIVIVDTPKSRMLLLDSTHNVHSILYKEQKWTGSYWDEFASLPAIVPKGPIAILGLGGGTAAHLMLHLWPSLQLEGWEIDEILIDKARDYFGLSDLEKTTEGGGILIVHIGDVFIPSENLHRRYAGIVVDLFSEGKVLPQLEEINLYSSGHSLVWIIWACSCMFSATTVSCKERDETLAEPCFPCTMCYKFCDEQGKYLVGITGEIDACGRFMVNCGGIDGESSPESLLSDETWLLNPTLKALSKAFPGQEHAVRICQQKESDTYAIIS